MSIRDKEILDFKIGDVFYECEAGLNIEAKVIELPYVCGNLDGKRQIRWKAVNTQDGEEISYLLTEGLSHYGPRLYRQPQYCQFKNGEIIFPLVGRED